MNHPLIEDFDGTLKVLVEAEFDMKHYALVEGIETVTYRYKNLWNRSQKTVNRKPTYFVLWGNDADLRKRGCTELRTLTGRKITQSSAIKHLHQFIKAGKRLKFKN